MKVGDYVRTGYQIAKITNLDTWCNLFIETDKGDLDKNKIVKSSPNIIDLIEVGDILSFKDGSICRIREIADVNGTNYYLLKEFENEAYWEKEEWLTDFNAIMTKKQFESMEYKIC